MSLPSKVLAYQRAWYAKNKDRMTLDWADTEAMKYTGHGKLLVDRIAKGLRDERSRAVEKCATASIDVPKYGNPPYRNGQVEGINNARRDIAAAIRGDDE